MTNLVLKSEIFVKNLTHVDVTSHPREKQKSELLKTLKHTLTPASLEGNVQYTMKNS